MTEYVQGRDRKPVPRPQPPMKDSRTRRERARSSQNLAAVDRSRRGE